MANEPVESEGIQDAQFGSDDRAFKLKAGRIYAITHSALDATGNKATASAIVNVPHDREDEQDMGR